MVGSTRRHSSIQTDLNRVVFLGLTCEIGLFLPTQVMLQRSHSDYKPQEGVHQQGLCTEPGQTLSASGR